MDELTRLIHKLGTNEDTLRHVKWMFEQNKEDISILLDSMQRTTFKEVIEGIYADNMALDTSLEGISPAALEVLFNKYGEQNYVEITSTLRVKFLNFVACVHQSDEDDAEEAVHCHHDVLVYLNGEHVHTFKKNTYLWPNQLSLGTRDLFELIAEKCLQNCIQFDLEDVKDMLQMGIAMVHIKKRLELATTISEAWGKPIYEHWIPGLTYFLRKCIRFHSKMFFEQLREIFKMYQSLVDRPHHLIVQEDYVCTREMKWSIHLEDPSGEYVLLTEDHPRYADLWARLKSNPMR